MSLNKDETAVRGCNPPVSVLVVWVSCKVYFSRSTISLAVMFTVLCRRLLVFLWRCSSVPFRLISSWIISLLYCSFVFLVFVSALLDRVLDAVLQWRFSSFRVVDLYLLLFSFVSALPGKIASCKNVMKCDVRTYVCMYGARAREPFRLP